ncbi:MAG: heavy metal-binding domain-containing protein [Segetibacter sp.]
MKDIAGMKMPQQKKESKKPVAKKVSNAPSQKVIYTCVMHPEVKMDKPGDYPKCGMKLVKKTIKVPVQKRDDMHDMQMLKDTLDGSHDMKEMNMTIDTVKGMGMSKNENSNQTQPVTYTCIMHPEIHSSKPGNCPKCGMKLVKEKTKAVPEDKMQMEEIMSCRYFSV